MLCVSVNIEKIKEMFDQHAPIGEIREFIGGEKQVDGYLLRGIEIDGDLVRDVNTDKVYYIHCMERVIREAHL